MTEYGKARLRQKRRMCKRKIEYKRRLNVEWDELERVYENIPEDCSVDHIIPLKHPNVSGLHVPWNFQYLEKNENMKKNNKFDGTWENESWRNYDSI